MRILTASTLAFIMLLGACGGSTLRPGRSISSELPLPDNSLERVWPGAVRMMLKAGYPVEGDWCTDAYSLPETGPVWITASSEDFAPVLALVAPDGQVLAASDGREGMAAAVLTMRSIPDGAELFVFGLDDHRGSFDLEITVIPAEETETVEFTPDLDEGYLSGWLPRNREYMTMALVLDKSFEDLVYCDNLQTARIHPFSVEEEALVLLDVPEAEFDPIMVLLEYHDGAYWYVDNNDDTDGLLPRIGSVLNQGDYAAVLLGYSQGEGGAYVLTMEQTVTSMLAVDRILVRGGSATGTLSPHANLAILIWEDIQAEDIWETSLTPSTPTVPFSFTVTDPDVYMMTAGADFDVCLTLLSNSGEGLDFVAYNDDAGFEEMGTNSMIERMLAPGDYTALVSAYYSGDEGEVTFGLEPMDTVFPELAVGRVSEASVSMDRPEVYYRFDIDPANVYTITAEDDILDPTIEVFLPDGMVFFDDDSGGDLNSMLTIYPSETQAGTCILKVSSYWSEEEGSISVCLERSSLN